MFDDLLAALTRIDRDVPDAERVDQLTALERVKAVCAAMQARITVDFAESQEQVAAAWRQRATECADDDDFQGWRAARDQARRASVEPTVAPRSRRRPGAEIGVAGQVALARREAPSRGARHLETAIALVRHLPRTLAALEVGAISEWRAEIVVRETAVLTADQRRAVDVELFEQLGVEGVGRLGDRELVRRIRAIAYRLDAESVLARCRGAEAQRRVTIRPAPDTMSYVTAYLPVAQGVAVYAALTEAAGTSRAQGDPRPSGQLMADLLVESVTGQSSAVAVPVEVQVVMTDRSLILGDDAPAQVPGYGTVPAGWARELLARDTTRAWVRRLYTHPADGTLVAMDSTRRVFDGGLRRFLVARDGTCATPWCDAPIRHLDHIVEHASGGETSAHNGQGLCVRCNHTKQLPGWRARPEPAPPPERWRAHTVVLVTPTGHRYASSAPPVLPGRPAEESLLERHLETLLAA
jgi:Domain of unknown function (DUF222)/HNH endonuclease